MVSNATKEWVSDDFKTLWKASKKVSIAKGEVWVLLEQIKNFMWWGVEGRRVIVQVQQGRFLLTVKDDGQVKVMFVGEAIPHQARLAYQFIIQREKLHEVRYELLKNQAKQREFRVLFGQLRGQYDE